MKWIKSLLESKARDYLDIANESQERNNQDLMLIGESIKDTYGYQKRVVLTEWFICKALILLGLSGHDTAELSKQLRCK